MAFAVYTAGCMLHLQTCLLVHYAGCARLFHTEHAQRVIFFSPTPSCQALKHSGRLIRSVPRAAAPIGSHS